MRLKRGQKKWDEIWGREEANMLLLSEKVGRKEVYRQRRGEILKSEKRYRRRDGEL